MLKRTLINKIIDIRLEEEKFYFPGEVIKGIAIVQPKSNIKVNSIQLEFFGQVYINLKEKETTILFKEKLVLPIHQNTLDASQHKFPFSFSVPNDLNLPSSIEFGKKAYIRYMIRAILNRPMLIESLCPKAEYIISVLELIDIEKEQFKIPQEKIESIRLPKTKYNQISTLKASIPRLGFTRGDVISIHVLINHFKSFSKENGLFIELVRTAEIRTSKHTLFKEKVIRSIPYNINMELHSIQSQQSIHSQLPIPTSTPPTLRYNINHLLFHYKVRISLHLSFDSNPIVLDIPIVIGTWPRASVPIDDDDEEDQMSYNSIQNIQEDSLTEEIESLKSCSISDSRRSSQTWYGVNQTIKGGSDRNSIVSNHSTIFLDSFSDISFTPFETSSYTTRLTRNTSQSTTLSSPDRLPSYSNINHHKNLHRASYPNHLDYRLDPIPNHILQPIDLTLLSETESSEEEDELDLLAILEKKKKREKRELRKKYAT